MKQARSQAQVRILEDRIRVRLHALQREHGCTGFCTPCREKAGEQVARTLQRGRRGR